MTSAFEELRESRDRLFSKFTANNINNTFNLDYTEIIDQYFRSSILESDTGKVLFHKKVPFAFIAVGGYGREELCRHSDIDILILFNKKIPPEAKELAEEIFFPLWDLGLELGYGVRSIKDCIILSGNDFEVLTSMMDARFICGDSPAYLSLMENLHKKVIVNKAVSFSKWLNNMYNIRMDTFGDASHLLEPNLKDGIGGLRDFHHILWLAKAFFGLKDPKDLEYMGKLSHKEYQGLEEHIEFLLLVRNYLHHLSNRKNDRLMFEYQEQIAKNLGFKNRNKIPAVEQFLGKLHASMEIIKTIHKAYITNHTPKKKSLRIDLNTNKISDELHIFQDEICFNSATDILEHPVILMDIFKKCAELDLPVSMESKRLITEFLYLVDDTFIENKAHAEMFLSILNNKNSDKVFDLMFETGFLDVYIPEFGAIIDRVQFDAYHIFPVGRHVLETVKNLKNLDKDKNMILLATFSDLSNPESLFLAGLFHDIGKVGKDHSRRGVPIARRILERFNYPKEETDKILSLIRNHLFLVETATRRDLDDEKVIVQCARTIGDIESLKCLYLLTWADSKATGPRAWNDWTGNLVQELFFKTLHILEQGELASPDSAQKVNKVKKMIRKETSGFIMPEDIEALFDIMPPRYLLNTQPSDVIKHINMVKTVGKDAEKLNNLSFAVDAREDESGDFWEICFVAKDRPGLFSDIAGVMSLNNINILSSNIFTWGNGIAVDIFAVTKPLDTIYPDQTWGKIEHDFKSTLSGKLSLPYRISQKSTPSILAGPAKPLKPPEVVVDNDSSDFFTIIEVFATDHVGLLYQITRTLFDMRMDIRVAKIGGKGDQIADIFYVHDLDGQKIDDKIQVKEIKKALLHQLKEKHTA